MLQPSHPLAKDRRHLQTGYGQLTAEVDDVPLEELLQVWQYIGAANAGVSAEEVAKSHGIHHCGVQPIRNAQLHGNVERQLPRLCAHCHARHTPKLLRQHSGQVLYHEGLCRQGFRARHVGRPGAVGGDAVHHGVVKVHTLLEPTLEGLQPHRTLREVTAAHVLPHCVAVERQVVSVDDAQGTFLPKAHEKTLMQELREVNDRTPVVRDASLSQAQADVLQLGEP
mmetsp:Transcript_3735/g.11812  ORF Transcript_3735/g.11812 Transcript_3735/m.11812 type:complete len:225 (-) Transcript_3735:391-1065(-)